MLEEAEEEEEEKRRAEELRGSGGAREWERARWEGRERWGRRRLLLTGEEVSAHSGRADEEGPATGERAAGVEETEAGLEGVRYRARKGGGPGGTRLCWVLRRLGSGVLGPRLA
jgi:hypothetical protein